MAVSSQLLPPDIKQLHPNGNNHCESDSIPNSPEQALKWPHTLTTLSGDCLNPDNMHMVEYVSMQSLSLVKPMRLVKRLCTQ